MARKQPFKVWGPQAFGGGAIGSCAGILAHFATEDTTLSKKSKVDDELDRSKLELTKNEEKGVSWW